MSEQKELHALFSKKPAGELRKAVFAVEATFPEAIKQSWPNLTIGILIAISLSAFAHVSSFLTAYIAPTSSWASAAITIAKGAAFVLEHLSVGFWVSSIAVLFYEWGSQAKSLFVLSQELGRLLQKEGEIAIRGGMTKILPLRPDLLRAHEKFVKALIDLDSAENWARDADVAFLTLFVEHAATYGGQLRTLRDHLIHDADDAGRPFHLDFTKLDYADKILTQWMDLLGEGKSDGYDTMSNPRTWSALKSGGFKEAGRKAVSRGAKMRRIFIMGREDDIHSVEDVRNLISHYQFAVCAKDQGKGSYRIQIATPEIFTPLAIPLENQHYGIFKKTVGDTTSSVAFKVKGTDVANFELVAVPPDGDLARDFNEIWDSLESSDEGPVVPETRNAIHEGASRFLDAVLSREARHLKKQQRRDDEAADKTDSHVEIVSTLESWKKRHDLPLFRKEIEPFAVRHLLVLSQGENEGAVVEEFRKEYAGATAGRGTREVKACHEDTFNERSRRWLASPRCQFVGPKGEPVHHCVFTLECEDDLSNFFLLSEDSMTKSMDYTKSFNRVWLLDSNTKIDIS
ncbi:MAG: hypothetical protein QOC81_2855 [Thermoanaerobaculia bacterium]|jgi:hypothetical protein|nr:hypothetical protein [Thermoanaerobaculia bacterium]